MNSLERGPSIAARGFRSSFTRKFRAPFSVASSLSFTMRSIRAQIAVALPHTTRFLEIPARLALARFPYLSAVGTADKSHARSVLFDAVSVAG